MIAIGELLIDFTPQADGSFMPCPGGAPCNMLAMAQRMGSRTAFIGKVGKDAFGDRLKAVLEAAGIHTAGLVQDARYNTTLAFVHLTGEGERSFSFYRKGCADVMLEPADINRSLVDLAGSLHFGSLSLTDEPSRSTVLNLLADVKAAGKLVTFDPNYRPTLWSSENEAVLFMRKGMGYADIAKVSEEELLLVTGCEDYGEGCRCLHELGVACVTVTLGDQGAYYSYAGGQGRLKGYPARVVDTTGAGDAFFGAFVHQLLQNGQPVDTIELADMVEYVRRANAAASLCVESHGGIPAIPGRQAVERRFLSRG